MLIYLYNKLNNSYIKVIEKMIKYPRPRLYKYIYIYDDVIMFINT